MKQLMTKITPSAVKAVALGLMLILFAPMVFAATDVINPEDLPGIIGTRTNNATSFRILALQILEFALSFLGFIAVIFVIYGGILYVTAGGEQEKVDNGKKILMYAGAGLIIILLSYALVNTILSAGTGVEPA